MQISTIKQHKSGDNYKIAQGFEYKGDDYWDWWIWIEAGDTKLDKIDNVIYNLHYTFKEPVKTISTRADKFKLRASGWGTFIIYARLNFKDGSVLELEHELELFYPDGQKTEA
ncbi:MAG: pYEATS domain-containing protein [Ferruginibacter sp.]